MNLRVLTVHRTRVYSHPRSPKAARSTPAGAYHSACSIAGAKFQGGILVAVGNPQWGIGSRIPPSRR